MTGAAPFERVGVVGVGLIGGSIALAVRERWPAVHVVGVDTPEILDEARHRGAIADGSSDLSSLADADLIVLAAPVRQNLSLLPHLRRHIHRSALVTDTGSTKRDIVRLAAELEPASQVSFVGGHPLAGAAVGGLRHARGDLFHRRPWVLTPRDAEDEAVTSSLATFVAALGATPRVMRGDEHDRVLAFISHLPQLAASALMAVVGEAVGQAGLSLAAGGLADTTRLASSPADIWSDIATSNADEIGPALDGLIAALTSLRRDLSDGKQIADLFDAAGRWRDQLVTRAQL